MTTSDLTLTNTGEGQAPAVYVDILDCDNIFVDTTYQRICDVKRARTMAANFDARLVGIIEVSDRGEKASPRFAVVDGQHRWAAVRMRTDRQVIVANIHTNLTIADEAALFDRLNRERKKVNIFEHFKAQLAAGDHDTTAINKVITKHHLVVSPAPQDGHIGCIGALRKVADIDTALLDETLELIISTWGRRRDGFDAPLVHGLALLIHHQRDYIDTERLVDALLDMHPRQLKIRATALRETQRGTLPVLTAHVITTAYNNKPGRPKIPVTAGMFGGLGQGARPAPVVVGNEQATDD